MNVNDLYKLTEKLFDRQNASKGIVTISGNAAQTPSSGTYYAVQFITECTPTVFTAANSTLPAAGTVYPAGTVLYLDVTSITCAVGDIYALYKA